MPDYWRQSDPERNWNFRRFATPVPEGCAARQWLARELMAEAADHRRHGDHGAAHAAELDAALLRARGAAR